MIEEENPALARTIEQRVTLNASPRSVYDAYLNAARHRAITGRRVRITPRAGASFTAFNGVLRGKNLLLVPGRMIVQTWRSRYWRAGDDDSILILRLRKVRGATELRLTHVNVPDHDHADVKKGWPAYYWQPWRKYLKARRKHEGAGMAKAPGKR